MWLVAFFLAWSVAERYVTDHTVWSASLHKSDTHCELLHVGQASHRLVHLLKTPLVKTRPAYHEIEPLQDDHIHHHEEGDELFIKVYAVTKADVYEVLSTLCPHYVASEPSPAPAVADKVTKLVDSGPATNRIDVVLMGDGYTIAEEQKMHDDMLRLTNDMFHGVTFAAYLPVFNVWSIFRESAQSGIGVGGRPRDTAFGLYRDGTQLRGVYCSKASAARQACTETGPDACDFPSLIGNDPYYGGLGGEFTISTSSLTSGTVVLRHEMGHNFIPVGEEYDGGSAYFGVNHSPLSRGADVTWKQWATEPTKLQIEAAVIRIQDYAWYDLANGPYQMTFSTNGTFAKYMIRYSVSGCETQDAIKITLDGQPVEWKTRHTLDRCIEDVVSDVGLKSGVHTLIFTQVTPPKAGGPIRQLCSVTLHEYREEPFFHFSNEFYGAYPTWRLNKVLVGYRPTNERCLMRNMTSQHFCSVCYEGMWLNFFSEISIIDDVETKRENERASIQLNTIKLGQLREGGAMPGEKLRVMYSFEGKHLPEHDDQFQLNVSSQFFGKWEVSVVYETPLVRSDPQQLLHFRHSFSV